MNDTAERIRRLIETRGMSARSLSEAAGLSHSTVSSLLAKLDANPDARVEARTLDKIAAALQVDATWLRTGRGDPAYVLMLILHELAHWMLVDAGLPDAHGDVWTLALALAAPESLLRRLRATGDLSAVRLAAETGMPWWAAALRIDMTVVMP